MKKFILLWLLILSTSLIAQNATSFNAYEVQVFDNSMNKVVRKNIINLTLTVTKTKLIIASTNDIVTFRFKGKTYNSSQTAFYSYALDERGVNCRIWFRKNSNTLAFGIEYSDYSYLYLVRKN